VPPALDPTLAWYAAIRAASRCIRPGSLGWRWVVSVSPASGHRGISVMRYASSPASS
jgi:hypothetical protein